VKNKTIYLLSPKVYEQTVSLPIIGFKKVVDKLDFGDRDTLLFTSKQAVVYTNELNKNWKNYKILAVGKATANMAKELGAKNIYHPKEFYGRVLANDIINSFSNSKILYIRPKVVSFDSKDFLSKHNIDIKEVVIYETNCITYKNIKLKKDSVIIFTSPSTIKCFFKSFKWDESFTAVVIGKSTLEHIPEGINVVVSNEATIPSCIKTAKSV